MKIGEVEYQADSKKVTFYYTAEGRVDFRELVRVFAREFKAKVEMKQIGLRQEAAKNWRYRNLWQRAVLLYLVK